MSKVLKQPSEYEREMADVFGTLISERPYKLSYSPGKSFTIIKNGRGMHFDPDIIDAITPQDLDGRILAWNPGAVRMYDWSEGENISQTMDVHSAGCTQ